MSCWRHWSWSSQGWGDRYACKTGLNEAKSKYGMKPKLPRAVAPVLQKTKYFSATFEVKLQSLHLAKREVYLQILKQNLSCKKFKFRVNAEEV
jgi:hypothetical protein